MAQCKLTPREFIGNVFSPQIGAVCSSAAEAVCQKNNLSFVELLQPFCNLNTEGHIKDPQGTTIPVRNLRLAIQDIYAQPPEPTVARKMLNDSVTSEQCDRTTVVTIGNINLEIPLSVSWFEAWRDMFLSVQYPSDHEFTKHFLACMIVISTSDENPLEKIQQMAMQLHQNIASKLPKWFNNNALRYYILIHDITQDEKAKAESIFTEMKNLYDSNNCFLLQMNSRPPAENADDNIHLPDPWSQFLIKHTDLSSSDHSSSPRTPADTGGVAAMPNEVISGADKPSQAGTPIGPQHPPILMSPDVTDKMSFSSEISEVTITPVEVGQEVVPVTIHPLSPESEKRFSTMPFVENSKSSVQITTGSPMNANVWADSPTRPIAQHGTRLSTHDLDGIRKLITEFCLKSLFPYVEKQIGILNDVISNKKGVSRSLFSATKRWFGTNKPGAPGSTPTNAVIYTVESPELQLRRLGDLCFMFGHYTLAYQAYHSAKRDFAADQAWLYYAGALEMAALSAFMQGEMTRKTIEYMDDAILTYSNSCKMPQFATRATILSAECLKGKNLYGEAAKQLIRMTSEDSDLRSALLLEQAAYCFVAPKMIHKYAFHAVLAGHRFSKAGQRKHSLRCYRQSYQVYRNRGWSLAEDHIHYTIGRQAASLKQVEEAVKAFENLLNPSSKQPAAQQAAFFREFLHIHNVLMQQIPTHCEGLPILPLPLIDGAEIKVLLGPLFQSTSENYTYASNVNFDDSDDNDSNRWYKLEEIIVAEAQGSASMIFKPNVILYSKITNNISRPNAVVNEPIHLSVELYNPLRIPLPLSKIKLIWEFTKDNETLNNELSMKNSLSEFNCVNDVTVDSVILQPMSRQRVILSCTPTQIGDLRILGISYSLSNPNSLITDQSIVIHGKRLFEIRGPKLKNTKEKRDINIYANDCRLDINVVDKAPYMQITFSKISPDMLCGEMQKIQVTLKNIGGAPLKNIHVGSTNSKLFCMENQLNERENSIEKKIRSPVTRICLPSANNGLLNVNETFEMPLWIRAPHKSGTHRLDLIFYYENSMSASTPRYRVCRHTWQLNVLNSIQIKAIARTSPVTINNLSTINLVVQVKNSNQNHDPFINEIYLTKLSLKSNTWQLSNQIVRSFNAKMQPQETCHLLFKLIRKIDNNENEIYSDVSLNNDENHSNPIVDSPYIDFVERRNILPQDSNDNFNSNQGKNTNITPLLNSIKFGATIILRWEAKVMEDGGVITRQAIGQHHVDLDLMDKLYKHPEEYEPEQNDYSTRLKVFGPDRNVPESTSLVKKDLINDDELQKLIITFSINHPKETKHIFGKQRMCIVPVTLQLQNNSRSRVDLKINTIGTSSQSYLPNVKSQLYSPHASTFFRYAGHTTIRCNIEPFGRHNAKLQAVISSPGTYDLASRLDIYAKLENYDNFIAQKWRTESICSVIDDNIV
ncbi:hypothetical protein PV328_002222 [Microctonus aethiopoides]|uniref:Trafficking protein particle complex subunit 8 n=1 Tax=Microctonus aethiopoides TaxID=144406 RepID=A0AA39KY57_9HYME|nr:hypothetical protein PV328_002222 [Microctonus aethiopoides]